MVHRDFGSVPDPADSGFAERRILDEKEPMHELVIGDEVLDAAVVGGLVDRFELVLKLLWEMRCGATRYLLAAVLSGTIRDYPG